MNNSNITKIKSIEEVKQVFNAWRNNRIKREPIPETLWQDAVLLHTKYPLFEIVKTLRLNYGALKERIKRYNKENINSNESQSFIKLELENKPVLIKTHSINFVLEKPDGWKLQMEIHKMSKQDINELIKSFMING